MARRPLKIGIMLSTTGPYATVGRAMLAGAQLAIDEVNDGGECPFELQPRIVNPGGQLASYLAIARSMLAEEGILHVLGCYTSSSRKEVLPLFEKHDGLLWYPSHYEGFETSDNVIYTGAAPNQHVIPLARHLLAHHGASAFLVGSNYIWGWENNRIMRELLHGEGGRVLGERYLPVGETDLGDIVEQIVEARPAFVFNTLIGTSSYAFLRELRAAATALGIDQPRVMPVASCSLAEPELAEIGRESADGHLSSSVYFASIDTPANRRFVAAWRRRFPELGTTSADAETAYIAIHFLGRALRLAGEPGLDAVREAAAGLSLVAPQGRVTIDAENRHCHMRPRIGRSTAEGEFELIYAAPEPVRPDPYLVWQDGASVPGRSPWPGLRVVS
ncbi:transporter substrate-binding domain-containing protein (plasmid) [Geminicoccaceae bacterium 1502E]|nr:transporter substrate-binding domain-containing protein [Geminicoccaceae bacterium 1502E]